MTSLLTSYMGQARETLRARIPRQQKDLTERAHVRFCAVVACVAARWRDEDESAACGTAGAGRTKLTIRMVLGGLTGSILS
jgi:hypothetical protein